MLDVQGNHSIDLLNHIVPTSGGVVECPREDSLLECEALVFHIVVIGERSVHRPTEAALSRVSF